MDIPGRVGRRLRPHDVTVTCLLAALLFSACGQAAQPVSTETVSNTPSPSNTPQPSFTPTPYTPSPTEVPQPTMTPTPIIEANGNITWRPQKALISWYDWPGDGVGGIDNPPKFSLLWDGTLLQAGMNDESARYISHLDNNEVCKLLNTIDKSGFFEEPEDYDMPFMGASSSGVQVNAWKVNRSGAQEFYRAVQGYPYFDQLFCRNCPIPSDNTIIRPGLANTYFLLKNYIPANRSVANTDPQLAKIPEDYTITCNSRDNTFSILPLDSNNKFWYYAPNGNWAAEVVKQRLDVPQKIRVVNKYGYSHIYTYDPALFGQTSVLAFPRYWSQDNRFFYVNVLRGEYQNNISLENSIALERIDAPNQKIKYIFISTNSQQSFAYEISHNGKTVAYICQGDNPLKIVFEDLVSTEQKVAIITDMNNSATNYIAAGTIVWSPDDSTLYLAATYQENGQRKSHILSIDAVNPVKMHIVYSSETEIKLQYDFGEYSAGVCPITATLDDYCELRINLRTGKIDQ